MNKEREIVALGWNGFPTKALYGEFPRASDKDKDVQQKKYPYIIHAEQNALLMRNTENQRCYIVCHENALQRLHPAD